jgi:transcriptional regulator with XRE-family HTH domain
MRKSLDVQLASYLRKARGTMSYAQFSKKAGLSDATLHRLENRERRITLNSLETLLSHLRIKMSDIFPDEF